MFVISFNICLFIYFSVKYAIQSNDCDVFVNKQSIYLSIYLHLQQLLGRLPNEIAISFLGKDILPVSSAKDLGIILDNNLTYDQHIHHLTYLIVQRTLST